MNRRGMLALADRYAALLDANGAVLQQADVDHRLTLPADHIILLNHARWQVEMVRRVSHRLGGEPTAVRLLGSAQGLLIAMGLVTVGETWRDNTGWLEGTSVRAFDAAIAELASAATE